LIVRIDYDHINVELKIWKGKGRECSKCLFVTPFSKELSCSSFLDKKLECENPQAKEKYVKGDLFFAIFGLKIHKDIS
jgi:hypothetical protein